MRKVWKTGDGETFANTKTAALHAPGRAPLHLMRCIWPQKSQPQCMVIVEADSALVNRLLHYDGKMRLGTGVPR